MVRALLEGRKTQTRRTIKLPTKGQYINPKMGGWAPSTVGGGASFTIGRDGSRQPAPEKVCIWHQTTGTTMVTRWQKGDRLWVRETFCYGPVDDDPIYYRATDKVQAIVDGDGFAVRNKDGSEKSPWRPGIHMPRWASRLTLTVTDVRVQRLQEISEADCLAEGIPPITDETYWAPPTPANPNLLAIYRGAYMKLWDDINGRGAAEVNPWIVAVTFTVDQRNIDAVEKAAA